MPGAASLVYAEFNAAEDAGFVDEIEPLLLQFEVFLAPAVDHYLSALDRLAHSEQTRSEDVLLVLADLENRFAGL